MFGFCVGYSGCVSAGWSILRSFLGSIFKLGLGPKVYFMCTVHHDLGRFGGFCVFSGPTF